MLDPLGTIFITTGENLVQAPEIHTSIIGFIIAILGSIIGITLIVIGVTMKVADDVLNTINVLQNVGKSISFVTGSIDLTSRHKEYIDEQFNEKCEEMKNNYKKLISLLDEQYEKVIKNNRLKMKSAHLADLRENFGA